MNTLSRGKFDAFFADPKHTGALVVMEACASSQYWARELLSKHRAACINHVRGLLAERGCVAAQGDAGFAELLTRILANPPAEVTTELVATITLMAEQLHVPQAQIHALDARLKVVRAQSPIAQRLDGIFGVGHVTATAFVGEYGHSVARFAGARQFAAHIGITLSEHASGEKRRLGAITKRGNPYLRKLLVQCAQAVVNVAGRRGDAICRFAQRLITQGKRRDTVVIAAANRLARIIHALLKHPSEYQPNPGLGIA